MRTSTSSTFALMALLFATVFAAPLNINMGAYSPAMVVGDGAIAFKDSTGASALMNTLQGSDSDDGTGGQAAPAAGAGANQGKPAAVPGSPNIVKAGEATPQSPGLGLGRKMVPSSEDENKNITAEEDRK
uniref:Putative secreted effector protein CSEP009 n=1 Tax=Podosphaera xanthii TaxID=135283 RepID=A0A2U7MKJ9_9PEZI|nr:putative secreted effector protein CSEP009 [Podosphaera xanthii]